MRDLVAILLAARRAHGKLESLESSRGNRRAHTTLGAWLGGAGGRASLSTHAERERLLLGVHRVRDRPSFLFCLSWRLGLIVASGRFSYRIVYYLLVGGFSTLGEEVGWRGFLQGALKPLGRVRGYLLLAILWEAWHFTSHTKGTLPEVMSRLEIYVPLVIAITFVLGFVTERTGSLLVAVTLHEWIDIVFDGSQAYLYWAAFVSLPVWLWLVWTWPKSKTPALQSRVF
jgi:hypothetical protein